MPVLPHAVRDATGEVHPLGRVVRRLLVVAVEGALLAGALALIGFAWGALG